MVSGAMAGLYCIFRAFLEVGDEVVLFEPTFPGYFGQIELCGAKIKTCKMKYEFND